jgi:NTE family protein
MLARRPSLTDPAPLRQLLDVTFGERQIEQGALPLYMTATNLLTGHERLLNQGPLVDALMATCAVPGLFPPVTLDGIPYVDGLLYGAPVDAALAHGHDTIYLLLTNSEIAVAEVPQTWWGVARRAATMVMWNQATIANVAGADGVTIRTVPAPTSMAEVPRWDFSHTERLLDDSYEAAQRWVAASPREEWAP